MADVETLAERVRTVERAVTDGATELPEATTLADVETRIESLEDRVADLDDRTTELEAATQALRGYVGNVRSVNEEVEQRADAALAATDRLERRLDEELPASEPPIPGPTGASTASGSPSSGGRARREPDTTGPRDESRSRAEQFQLERDEFGDPSMEGESMQGAGRNASADGTVSSSGSDETSELGLLARIRAHL
jgi:chromosome segregation ATPase